MATAKMNAFKRHARDATGAIVERHRRVTLVHQNGETSYEFDKDLNERRVCEKLRDLNIPTNNQRALTKSLWLTVLVGIFLLTIVVKLSGGRDLPL